MVRMAYFSSRKSGRRNGRVPASVDHSWMTADQRIAYPDVESMDKELDMTRLADGSVVAKGEQIEIRGQVTDVDGIAIPNAMIDIWQANSAGRYLHETESESPDYDPNFQGWAILRTDAEGRFHFRTVRPGSRATGEGHPIAPHIHVKVSHEGYRDYANQLFFEGHPLNDGDLFLAHRPKGDREQLILRRDAADAAYICNLVLIPE